MIEQIKYDIDDKVLVNLEYYGLKEGVISMITINRQGVKYRAKFGYDMQSTFTNDDVVEKR